METEKQFPFDFLYHVPKHDNPVLDKDRILHMYAVAELMQQNAGAFNCEILQPDELYVLGLLHDIGYLYGRSMHEDNGQYLITELIGDQDNIIPHCIQWHNTSPYKYMEHFNITVEQIPQELVLLWYSNMMVNSVGEVVSFTARLDEIADEFGKDSDEYSTHKSIVEFIISYMSTHNIKGISL